LWNEIFAVIFINEKSMSTEKNVFNVKESKGKMALTERYKVFAYTDSGFQPVTIPF